MKIGLDSNFSVLQKIPIEKLDKFHWYRGTGIRLRDSDLEATEVEWLWLCMEGIEKSL